MKIPSPGAIPLLATLMLVLAFANARAQTATAGHAVAPTHLAYEGVPTTVPDGMGGAFIGLRAIVAFVGDQPATFVAHVDATGTPVPGWNVEGIGPLAIDYTFPVNIASVTPGRAWLAPDYFCVGCDPFLARAVGDLGLTVPDSSVAGGRDYQNLSITALASGRILIASKRTVPAELQVAFIEHNGALTESGATITLPAAWDPPGNSVGPPAMSDGVGGAWVLCDIAPTSTDRNLAIVRIASTGSPLTVRTVCSATRDQTEGVMCRDGGQGVFIAWTDARDLTKAHDVFAAHLLADGNRATGWGIQGNAIASVAGDQFQPQIVSDFQGGAWLVWTDSRSGENDIYYTHIGADGTLKAGFPVGGKALCAATGSQVSPRAVADGDGGFYAVWLDQRSGGLDLYAQHIRWTGLVMPGWTANGLAVCTEGTDQQSPALVLTSTDHALATWIDSRAGYQKVYAAALPPDAPPAGVAPRLTATALSLKAAQDPARGEVVLLVSSTESGDVRVSLHDVTGRLVSERTIAGPVSDAHVRFATERLVPGLYFARASRAGTLASTRISLVH